MPVLTAGPQMAGAGVSDGGSSFYWVSPGRVTAADGSYTYCSMMDDGSMGQPLPSAPLKTSAHGFAIPSSAWIRGILVEALIHEGGNMAVYTNSVMLAKAGVGTGALKGAGALWPTPAAIRQWGGIGDLWGSIWTPADVNAAGFGALITAEIITDGSAGEGRAEVDWVRIYVYYELRRKTMMLI